MREGNTANLSAPLPPGQESVRLLRADWSGLNYRQTLDTGVLSYESNISTDDTPYLTPSPKRAVYKSGYANPISMFGFDDFLLVVYADGATKIDYITADGTAYTGVLGTGTEQRSIVKFNVYDTPTDPIGGSYIQKLLIFPDKKSMDFRIASNFTPASMDAGINRVPDIRYAAVHLSRLFGVDGDRVYASGFNDYTNWNLDTVDEQNTGNAWCSPAQANTKANGSFTGITAYQNHVMCFKRDYMHEIQNNKNPFRIYDIFADGTIDNRSIAEVGGQLIFVNESGVKVYGGARPRNLGYYLGADRFYAAVAGTDGKKYYLYCKTEKKEHNLFVYDSFTEQWAEESIDFEALSFAHTSSGMYMLGKDGNIYKLDSDDYSHEWGAETDVLTNGTADARRVQKIQIFADMGAGSKLEAYLLYGGEEYNPQTSHKIFARTNTDGRMRRTVIRVIPRRTANCGFRLRLNGYGYSRVYQLEISLKQGGELYV